MLLGNEFMVCKVRGEHLLKEAGRHLGLLLLLQTLLLELLLLLKSSCGSPTSACVLALLLRGTGVASQREGRDESSIATMVVEVDWQGKFNEGTNEMNLGNFVFPSATYSTKLYPRLFVECVDEGVGKLECPCFESI